MMNRFQVLLSKLDLRRCISMNLTLYVYTADPISAYIPSSVGFIGSLPLLGSHDHSLMSLSPPAVAMTRSVGEKATAQTPRLWPRSTPAGMRSGSRHSRAVRSPEH